MYRTMFDASGRNHFNKRDEELKQRDEELEHLRVGEGFGVASER